MNKSSAVKKNSKDNIYILIFLLIFLIVFILSFNFGKYPITPKELINAVFSKIFNIEKSTPTDQIDLVIFKIRMPRLIAAALVGAGLSVAGAAYQGLFKNPMVSPDILGATSGAGFGASLAIVLYFNYFFISIFAFAFSFLAVIISYIISLKIKQNPTLGMVLSGMMIGSLCTAGISYIKLVADPNNQLPAITYWLMGSLSSVTMKEVKSTAIPIVIGIFSLYLIRWKLNLLSMGEEEAKTMGVNTTITRIIIIVASTLITAACVSISGMIGWIGLVIPHFSRMIVKNNYMVMLPVSMLLGATFLIIVDNFSRTISTVEIPIGILTALIGAPLFLYLLFKKGNEL